MRNNQIQQHFYTRTNRGYGTVARSAGLTDAFIRENILPYCAHPTGAGDTSMSWVHLPDGRMLLGQSVKQGHVFFRHDYVIDAHRAEEALQAIASNEVKFETSHDASSEEALPELDKLPLFDTPRETTNDGILPPTLLNHYIAAAQRAVIQGKRLYLPSLQSDTHHYAMAILAQLLPAMPTSLRHLMGVCTSAEGKIEKKRIHLVFTSKIYSMLDFGEKIDIMDDEAFFVAYFASMTESKFCTQVFDELAFWPARAPAIAHGTALCHAITTRMADVLDIHKLTAARAVSWPERFVRRGLCGRYARYIGFDAEAFAPADILRRAVHDKATPDLGNYRLHPAVQQHIEQQLQHIR